MSSNLNIIQNTAIHINPSPPIRAGVTYWVGRVVISNANNYHCKALNRTTTKESYFDLFWKKTMKYLVIMLTFILLVFVFESKGQSADITFIHYSDTSEIGLDREIGFPIINTENNIIDSIKEGVDIIYQPYLSYNNTYGYPDMIVKSSIGDVYNEFIFNMFSKFDNLSNTFSI